MVTIRFYLCSSILVFAITISCLDKPNVTPHRLSNVTGAKKATSESQVYLDTADSYRQKGLFADAVELLAGVHLEHSDVRSITRLSVVLDEWIDHLANIGNFYKALEVRKLSRHIYGARKESQVQKKIELYLAGLKTLPECDCHSIDKTKMMTAFDEIDVGEFAEAKNIVEQEHNRTFCLSTATLYSHLLQTQERHKQANIVRSQIGHTLFPDMTAHPVVQITHDSPLYHPYWHHDSRPPLKGAIININSLNVTIRSNGRLLTSLENVTEIDSKVYFGNWDTTKQAGTLTLYAPSTIKNGANGIEGSTFDIFCGTKGETKPGDAKIQKQLQKVKGHVFASNGEQYVTLLGGTSRKDGTCKRSKIALREIETDRSLFVLQKEDACIFSKFSSSGDYLMRYCQKLCLET